MINDYYFAHKQLTNQPINWANQQTETFQPTTGRYSPQFTAVAAFVADPTLATCRQNDGVADVVAAHHADAAGSHEHDRDGVLLESEFDEADVFYELRLSGHQP